MNEDLPSELSEELIEAMAPLMIKLDEELANPEKIGIAQEAIKRVRELQALHEAGTHNKDLPEVGTDVTVWPNYYGAAMGDKPEVFKIHSHWKGRNAQILLNGMPAGSLYPEQFWIDDTGAWNCQLF